MNKYDLNAYYGKWLAMDDKDRIISFTDNKTKVLNESITFSQYLNQYGIRLYPIFDRDIKDTLKELID